MSQKYKKYYSARPVLLILILAVFFSILFYPAVALAVDITLEWDASSGADGYRLFYREDSQSYDYNSPDWQGPGTTCTIYGLDDLTTYHFVVRAYNAEGESGNSNEETYPLASSPSISLSTNSLSNSSSSGTDAPNQTFRVWNSGSGTLNYSISDNRSWLSCSPSNGTSTGEQDTITVTYSTSGLSAGNYSGTITITDANAGNSPQTISVSLNVAASNAAPDKPVIISPVDGEIECDPLIHVTADPFSDSDAGDFHSKSLWSIIKQQDSSIVLEIESNEHLTTLPVPHTVLDRDTTYLVSVQFYDAYPVPSGWSDPVEFTTTQNIVDFDGDGIPDGQEVDDTVDLNGDGIPDNNQPSEIKCVESAVAGNVAIGVSPLTASIDSIEVIEPINPVEILDKTNKPATFLFGLFSYRLRLNQIGDTVLVTIYFSDDISNANRFYIYDTLNGWQDYTQYTTFNGDGHSITVELQDGGHGDSDGVANSIIVDPGGVVGAATLGADSGAGGGCFIATAASGS